MQPPQQLGATSPSTTSDDKGDAWKLFGGYQFTKNWAVEFAYVDFGKTSADTTATGGRCKIESTAKGWSLAGVGTAMVSDNLGLFGKLGVLSYEVDAKLSTVSGHGRKFQCQRLGHEGSLRRWFEIQPHQANESARGVGTN